MILKRIADTRPNQDSCVRQKYTMIEIIVLVSAMIDCI